MTDLSRERKPEAETPAGIVILTCLPFVLAFCFLLEWML